MAKPTKLSFILLLSAVLFSVFSINSGYAQDSILPNPENLDDCSVCPAPANSSEACQLACKKQTGDYDLNDFARLAVVISNMLLGIVGSLALLAFVAGGLMWLLSTGKAELVERGKQTIIGATVGLAIVFTSYMIIQLVFAALGIPNTTAGEWAKSTWTSVWSK